MKGEEAETRRSAVCAKLADGGLVRHTSEIMILGNGPTRDMGLREQRGLQCDLWAINDLPHEFEPTAVFNMHADFLIRGRFLKSERGFRDYDGMETPAVMQREWEEIPGSVKYPLFDMISYFQSKYFANTLPYMIALAWYMGYEFIHFFGVDYWNALRLETAYERPGTEYWMGRYYQAGGRFGFPPESHLLTGFYNPREMYGYQVNPEMTMPELEKAFYKELEDEKDS